MFANQSKAVRHTRKLCISFMDVQKPHTRPAKFMTCRIRGEIRGSEASNDTLHIATELRRNLDFVRTDRGKYADLILTFTYVQQCDDHQHHNEQRQRELRQVVERTRLDSRFSTFLNQKHDMNGAFVAAMVLG